jgi:hypothetical protein
VPLDAPCPEFRELFPWPDGLRYLNGRTERILQNWLPPRPDYRSYTGSTAAQAADADLAEPGGGDFAAERRVRDAERKRPKRGMEPVTAGPS